MLEESDDELDPESIQDEFVEQLTGRMEQYISIQLNLGNETSIYKAFVECS